MANKITVTSAGTVVNANVTPDTAMYYSNKSKDWAISDKLIDNEDYSSKYYANESKKQADISTAKATEVVESGNTAVSNIENARNNAINDVNTAGATQVALATEQATIATNKASEVVASGNEALSNIDTAKNNAITSITNQETTSKTSLIDEGATQIGLIQNEGATQVANVQSTGFYMRDDKLYYINSQGQETEFKLDDIELNNPYSLFDSKYSDHELFNLSWLVSNGSYNGSNAIHPSAYQALLVENNAEVAIGSTVTLPNGIEYTKQGLSVKLSTDSDITDYDFVIKSSDETFRPPLKTNLASGKAVVGNGMTLGLTDGTANYGLQRDYINTTASYNQVHTSSYGKSIGTPRSAGTNSVTTTIGITTDPTKSGIELSDSGLYLYFYVGETVQNANLIDAGRIGEQLANKQDKLTRYPIEISDKSLMPSWYVVYSDGWCEQGGFINTNHGTISLLKTMQDTNYIVTVQPKASDKGYPSSCQYFVSELTTNSFYSSYQGLSGGSGSPLGRYWQASGYIA